MARTRIGKTPTQQTEGRRTLADDATSLELLEELEGKLHIDKDDLDTALVDHPQTFYDVSKAYTLALSNRDQAKLRMDEAEAEIAKTVREDLGSDPEIKRVTNDMVKEQVYNDSDFKTAHAEYLDLVALSARWGALQEAFKQRSFALRELAGLYVAGYFGASVGRASKDVGDTDNDRRRASMARARRGEDRDRSD